MSERMRESDLSDRSDKSDRPDKSDSSDKAGKHRLIPKHGGYRKLRSFQTAQRIYDGTVAFCSRFVGRRSRVKARNAGHAD
jgi:hypothetical protein